MSAEQPPSEENVLNAEDAAIDKDVTDTPLAMAVLSLFTGRVGRRWKVGEIERKLKALGFSVSRNGVMLALGELEAHLEDNLFLPWILVERADEWFLVSKNVVVAALEGVPALNVSRVLNDEQKAVLLVVIGYRRKGGVSATRIAEILGLSDSTINDVLAVLEKDGLIYADPARYYSYWRPKSSATLALGIRANSDIPELKELELYFDSLRSGLLESALASSTRAAKRHASRRQVQSRTLPLQDEA